MDRKKETDETGWFSITVNKQERWTIHAGYNEQFVEAVVDRESIHNPIRLIIPDERFEVSADHSETEDKELPPVIVTELLKDPTPLLRRIKQHLSQQSAGRDYLESIVSVLVPLCQNNQETAQLVLRQLIYEQYLTCVAGDRCELSLKAVNLLSKRR